MKYSLTSILIYLLYSSVFLGAQEIIQVKGIIKDSKTQEPLEAVSISVIETKNGTYSNLDGSFEISLQKSDSAWLRFSYIGYKDKTIEIDPVNHERTILIQMSSQLEELSEVIIQANSLREKFNSSNTSVESIDAKDAQVLPALFGEVDIIKTLQLKPGITSGSEGSSNLYVRGGNGDQNLVLLDGVNIYNPSHLFGFFSTFNNDALQSVDIFKGGFPAKYGGRLSSVLDIRTKDPNPEKLSGSGGLGIISSRLMLEGPLMHDKVTFLISGRRTYLDAVTKHINKANEANKEITPIPQYWFYDLNGKISAKINDKNALTLSGHIGSDDFSFKDGRYRTNLDWGNEMGSLQWNHSISQQLLATAAVFTSKYTYDITNSFGPLDLNITSNIADQGLRLNVLFDSKNGHLIQGGIQTIHHRFNIGRYQAGSMVDTLEFSTGSALLGRESAFFIGDQFNPWKKITINLGIRYTKFSSQSRYYHNTEPRFAVSVDLSRRLKIKSSYARMNQYVHLVSNTGISLPTDIWYPTTDRITPQRSDQVVLGMQYLIKPSLMFTNEYYYKALKNQIELKDHAQIFANDDLEEEFSIGNGYAYGSEIGIEKKSGRWTGWMGYTLAWVRRGNFNEIEGGRHFSPKYDRRHDLSFVSSFQFNKKWTASATFVFGSGDKAWLPEGRFYLQDIPEVNGHLPIPVYGTRNTINLPSYHRADIAIVRSFKTKWSTQNFTFSLYNLYNRRNPYFLYLNSTMHTIPNGSGDLEIPVEVSTRQVSLFPVLPSISWNFKF